MDMQIFMRIMTDNMPFIVSGMGIVIFIMLGIMINQGMKLSYMKRRYRKMMTGVDGANIERMLMGHIDEVKKVVATNDRIDAENQRLDALLQTALTRVGVVRFRALKIWEVTLVMRLHCLTRIIMVWCCQVFLVVRIHAVM